jgi:hypothetical protein
MICCLTFNIKQKLNNNNIHYLVTDREVWSEILINEDKHSYEKSVISGNLDISHRRIDL